MTCGYCNRVRSYQDVTDSFNNTFSNNATVLKLTVFRTAKHFQENNPDRRHSGRRNVWRRWGDISTHTTVICGEIIRSLLEKMVLGCQYSGHRIMKAITFCPQNIRFVYELSKDDFGRSIDFVIIETIRDQKFIFQKNILIKQRFA